MGLPIPNLDDRTFDEIVKEARSLIARYAPEWTDHNVHDPGITFIELFAWLAEMQIYQLNRVTDRNYERFLKLVGLHRFPPRPARIGIAFKNVADEKAIKSGTRIVTEVGGERVVFETEEGFTLIPILLKSVTTAYDSRVIDYTDANEKEGVYFYPFGEEAPRGATLELGFDSPLPQDYIHITFILSEEDFLSGEATGMRRRTSLHLWVWYGSILAAGFGISLWLQKTQHWA